MREADLYAPVKAFLETLGYTVKAEIGPCDVLAVRDPDPPVIVELKTGFSLALIHQAIDRQRISDAVYIAVPRGSGRPWRKSLKNNLMLARRLGLGVLTVRPADGLVEAHVDPAPYRPRAATARRDLLLREFARRAGDPNTGGTRGKRMTAYRQDSLRIAAVLADGSARKGADVARESGVARATTMMRTDPYGWFEKVETGIYRLSPRGRQETAAG